MKSFKKLKRVKHTNQTKQSRQLERKDKLKIILIISLSLVSAVLIYFYITEDKPIETYTGEIKNDVPLTKDKLNTETDSVLYTFGIKKEWIKTIDPKDKDLKKISVKNIDLLISKEVYIPDDLPVIELNSDITNFLKSRKLDVRVIEDPRSKDLLMNIFRNGDTSSVPAGILKFSYMDSLRRNTSDVCIVLDSIDALPLEESEEILKSASEVTVFLPLRNDKAEHQSLVTEQKTDHLIKLYTGNEDDILADFRDNMKESQWMTKVKSASISFANSAGIILYKSGSNSEFYNIIKEEFRKNNITVYEDTIFTNFSRGENKILSLIESIISENGNGKRVLYYSIFLTNEEFKDYEKKISLLKKSGFKFNNFSKTVKKNFN